MNVLPGKTTAILLSSAALFTAGLWLGHRLTRDHYQGIIARQALRFTEERRKLNEAAAQAWIDAERKVLSAERQKEKELSKIDHQYQQELQHAKAQNARTLADLDPARLRVRSGRPPTNRVSERRAGRSGSAGQPALMLIQCKASIQPHNKKDLMTPEANHRRFAIKTKNKNIRIFRNAGRNR